MDMSLRGRLSNTKLPTSRSLLPLFEGVVNSIHGIEELHLKDGKIDISIQRSSQKSFTEGEKNAVAAPAIIGFTIQDNGSGFNDTNLASFKKADSILKIEKGGKGVGRFLWLIAFRKAEIESVYEKDGQCWKRTFDFEISDSGVERETNQLAPGAARMTTVRLIGLKKGYADNSPKTAVSIGRRIIEHCLEYFAQSDCPSVRLHDPAMGDDYDLNHLFKTEMQVASERVPFTVKGEEFSLHHLMITSASAPHHSLHFCAHKRAVRSENAAKVIPNLEEAIKDPNEQRQLIYSGYVSGHYLDDRVQSERTKFDISDEEYELNLPTEISWPEIIGAAAKHARQFLDPYTVSLGNLKRDRIKSYVETKSPKYRPILKHRSNEVDEIQAGLTDEKLELELYKIAQRYDAELLARYQSLLMDGDKAALTLSKRHEDTKQFLEEWNEAGMSKLAEHVAFRKATIGFLQEQMRLNDKDKYPLEESIHEVIFPLRKTSDDVRPDQMNLWMIDERLAYHHFLASDKQFDQLPEIIDIQSRKRTDLMMFFDNPFSFCESPLTFNSVVIVEFKRPSRDDYDDDSNPIDQVFEYVELFKAGKAKDRRGAHIDVPANMQYYAYIICDLTPKLRTQAGRHFLPTPDGEGYFGYSQNHHLYTEIISFKKLFRDASSRNKILFDKLGIL